MLNIENIKKLISALRSGEYKQGQRCLRDGDKFCCLGVACDIYSKENKVEWSGIDGGFFFLDSRNYLPEEVRDYFGFIEDNSYVGEGRHLANLNDAGGTFAKIADILEEYMNENSNN